MLWYGVVCYAMLWHVKMCSVTLRATISGAIGRRALPLSSLTDGIGTPDPN